MKRNKFYQRHELIPCELCSKERWVMIIKGKPRSRLCRECHNKNITGKNSPKFNNGITTKHGYILVRQQDHPRADYHGYVLRAIVTLEKKLGRPLLKGYIAHHLNNVKADDRPENLIELSPSAHSTLTNYIRYQY